MPKPKITSQILRSLADDRRAIVADWRFHVVYARLAASGSIAFPDAMKVRQLIKKLQSAGEIKAVEDIPGIYRVVVPYASFISTPDEAVVQEANPIAVFSHYTAASYHDLTFETPRELHLTHYPKTTSRLPLGTTPEDWLGVPEPRPRTPSSFEGIQIYWHKSKKTWDFGSMLGYSQGCPVYITDIERTVLDCLRFPDRSGGPQEVLRIWKRAAPKLRLEILIKYVEQLGQKLLKQRVGFILEKLKLGAPVLNQWAKTSVRGSSARLFAGFDFSPVFSERWNLSINVPDAILSELEPLE